MKKTAKHYHKNKTSYAKKLKEDKKINARPSQVKKRTEANKKRAEAKKTGKNVTGKDYDHKTKSFISSSKNRGQNEKSRMKGSKRK